MEACERANSDRDDPAAYCAAIMRRTEGHCMESRTVERISAVVQGSALDDLRPRLRLARPVARLARPWYRITAKAADPEAAPEPAEGDKAEGGDDAEGEGEPTTDGDTTVIDIYDEIGWFGTGAKDFVRDLRQVKTRNIEVHLNSPGGDVFDALAIYNGLRQHKAKVHVIVDSLAASSASFIAMAGDKVTAMANAMLMIHDPWGLVIGNAADMRELADLLDKHGDNIASIYASKAGGDVAEWRERMLGETWYLADEAHAAGLVDVVDDADGRPVEDTWDLTVFAHGPDGASPFRRHPDADSIPPRVPVAASAAPPEAAPADPAAPDPSPSTTTRTAGGLGRDTLGGPASWYLPSPPKEAPAWPMP
jgi:ATP-dependent Clp endopeptidase proteolytic subunit ClpP